MPELSIVMPCYIKNEELLQLTRNALHSLVSLEMSDFEVIIVDDDSPLGGGVLRDSCSTYIKHHKNQGFVRSVNDGINLARGKFIAVANNDIRVAPNYWEVASEILYKNEDVFSVHPRMCFYDEPLVYGDKTFMTGRERWCQSSLFIIRNDGVFNFPETFKGTGGGYEDWFAWSYIRKLGYKTAYTTKTCFQHKDSSTTQIVGEKSKHHKENRELFKRVFDDYPEEYYARLYPEQMQMDWRGTFTEL